MLQNRPKSSETLRIPKGILSILVAPDPCLPRKISASAHIEFSQGNLKGSATFNVSKNRNLGHLFPLEKIVEIEFPGFHIFRTSKISKNIGLDQWFRRPATAERKVRTIGLDRCFSILFYVRKSRHPGKSISTTLLNGKRCSKRRFFETLNAAEPLRFPRK